MPALRRLANGREHAEANFGTAGIKKQDGTPTSLSALTMTKPGAKKTNGQRSTSVELRPAGVGRDLGIAQVDPFHPNWRKANEIHRDRCDSANFLKLVGPRAARQHWFDHYDRRLGDLSSQ